MRVCAKPQEARSSAFRGRPWVLGLRLACLKCPQPPSFARMPGFLTRSRARLLTRAPCQTSFPAPCQRYTKPTRLPKRKPSSGRVPLYWADHSRLKARDEYPLSRELAALGLRGDPLQTTRSNTRVRTQIVSPALCGMLNPGTGEMAADVSNLPLLIALRR
jgi:hypothetical protein